ncbi:3-hydroxyacyl-CoA dehydrogenase [Gemmobacter serpentinus]|uniref:3-hydroxyacyl-CoA dehydrogenase n=1 Tax=Gemmobacter serpentinus TaxID=2652247 RepID=UPI00124C0530|nr:3-hydroxyacyl-CoA dehydrogenase [Gemmobacter serpentinus]
MAKPTDPATQATRPSGTVAIIGTGFIGQSWAIVFARAGLDVRLYDADAAQTAKAQDYIARMLPELAQAGLLGTATAAEVGQRISGATTLAAVLDGVFYVQENAPERLDIKRKVFAELDAVAAPDTILASSTSALLPSSFTADLPGAARCVVAHPINPPHLVPAVEVVPGSGTSEDTVARTADLMRAVGQATVVMHKEIDGFIVNRLQGALLHEAFRLFADGYADTESIDVCVRDGLGLRWSFMGPFETIDLNAPGGVTDYIDRYGPFYHRLWPGAGNLPDWQAVGAQVELERTALLPRNEMPARQIWRDSKLIELAAARLKPQQDAK